MVPYNRDMVISFHFSLSWSCFSMLSLSLCSLLYRFSLRYLLYVLYHGHLFFTCHFHWSFAIHIFSHFLISFIFTICCVHFSTIWNNFSITSTLTFFNYFHLLKYLFDHYGRTNIFHFHSRMYLIPYFYRFQQTLYDDFSVV